MLQQHRNQDLDLSGTDALAFPSRFARGLFEDDLDFLSDRFERNFFNFDPFEDIMSSTRMIRDVEEDFFHPHNNISEHAFDHAKELIKESSEHQKLNEVKIEKPVDLLEDPDEDLEQLYKSCPDKKHAKIEGVVYQTSSITKDGKTATVSKMSQLNPNGKIRTKVNEKVEDVEGHCKSKTWRKYKNLKSNANQPKSLTHGPIEIQDDATDESRPRERKQLQQARNKH